MVAEQKSDLLSVGELAERLISEATPVATELCQHGAMASLSCVVGVEAERATIVATIGLLQGMLFRTGYTYRECNEREVPTWLRKRITNAIARAGDLRFSNRFSTAWQDAEIALHTKEAIMRIDADGHGDPFRQRASSTVECVNWTLKELNAGGPSDLIISNRLLFWEIVAAFSFFSLRNERMIDWTALSARKTQEIDLSCLPLSKVKYDVFISYRRSDGLQSARVLKQALEKRGNRCFLDVDKIEGGQYNPQILASLKASDNIVFLMTNDAVANLDDPDNPVRIELETSRKLQCAITIVTAPGTTRSLGGIELPPSLEFLRGLHKYRLQMDEFFEESLNKIVTQGFAVRRGRFSKLLRHVFN